MKTKKDIKENEELSDEDNPEFLFNGINTSILTKAIKGEINLMELVKKEMANRGFDEDGKWIGFDEAEKLYFGSDEGDGQRVVSATFQFSIVIDIDDDTDVDDALEAAWDYANENRKECIQNADLVDHMIYREED